MYIVDTSERSASPRCGEPVRHLALVAGQLHVHVQLDVRVGRAGEVVEPLVERQAARASAASS